MDPSEAASQCIQSVDKNFATVLDFLFRHFFTTALPGVSRLAFCCQEVAVGPCTWERHLCFVKLTASGSCRLYWRATWCTALVASFPNLRRTAVRFINVALTFCHAFFIALQVLCSILSCRTRTILCSKCSTVKTPFSECRAGN